MEGWIKLHRKILKWEWFDDSKMIKFFIYCLLKANYEDAKWRGQTIEKGSFISSLNKISIDTNLSIQQIRTLIDKLKSTHEITCKSTKKYTVITICNFDSYQVGNTVEQHTEQHTNQHTSNTQVTTSNNINNIYNINNNIDIDIDKEEINKKEKYKKEKNKQEEKTFSTGDLNFSTEYLISGNNENTSSVLEELKSKIEAQQEKIMELEKNTKKIEPISPKKQMGIFKFYTKDDIFTDEEFNSLPQIIQDCKDIIEEWSEYKRDIKEAYVKKSAKRILILWANRYKSNSDKLRSDIEQAIANSWKGVHDNIGNYGTKSINKTNNEVKLGCDEWIRPDGTRTYGDSGITIPMDAPPRPSRAYLWMKSENKWFNQ